jgi:Cys-tRNA(Pro) deacylase
VAIDKTHVTPAVRQLRAAGVQFSDHPYEYEERGGTAVSARELGVHEFAVIKTLVMEDEQKKPLIVLMHGNNQVSTKELARMLGVKSIQPCSPEVANRHTGYLIGGTSPLGIRKPLPIYMERTILDLQKVYINGGKRGYLIGIVPGDLVQVLHPTLVSVAIQK